MRIHGKGERALFSKNWDDKTKAIVLNYDKLRYRLLPYTYSLAAKVTNDNYTIMRSLAFDFRNDKNVYNIPDQYMFGPAFLVNPVTKAMYTAPNADEIAKTRQVYLPKGNKWYNFWTGAAIEGGQTIEAAAPIETMPLYVKAGSVVPMGPNIEYATQNPGGAIELRVYAGADGTFKYYEDENDNYNYEKGAHAAFSFKWNDKLRQLTITDRKGSYPGMPQKRVFNIVLVKDGHGENVAITKADKSVTYSGRQMVVKL